MKLTIELPDHAAMALGGAGAGDIELLLRDALANFLAHRRDAVAYVAQGYSGWAPERQERKVKEVAQRVEWAKALMFSDVSHVIE